MTNFGSSFLALNALPLFLLTRDEITHRTADDAADNYESAKEKRIAKQKQSAEYQKKQDAAAGEGFKLRELENGTKEWRFLHTL